MTKEEYGDFALRYKGCGACFPMYHTLSRFEKMWFTAIQKDVTELTKTCDETQELLDKQIEATLKLDKENAELKKKVENLKKYLDTQNCYRECAETWLKLTEAKKLLKQFLEAKNSEDTYKAEWEAEQFIKDSEVKK